MKTAEKPDRRRVFFVGLGFLLLANFLGLVWLFPHIEVQTTNPAIRQPLEVTADRIQGDLKREQLPQNSEAIPQNEALLSEMILISPLEGYPEGSAPEGRIEGMKDKVVVDFGAEDTTGNRDIRSTAYQLGVGYKVSDNSVLGIEAQKEIHDLQASEKGAAPEEQDVMQVRYKLKF